MTTPLTLQPGAVYHDLDAALTAASCLCGLSEAGATIYGRVVGLEEEYRVAVLAERPDGSRWDAPSGDDWAPVYTITRAACD